MSDNHRSTRNGRIKGRRDFTKRLHEQRIKKAQEEHEPSKEIPWTPTSSGGGVSDPLVVKTSALAAVVNEWIAKHEAQANREGGWDSDYIGPYQYIEHWSGLATRIIYGVTRCQTTHTTLGKADKILTAIGLGHLLETDPELYPFPNPHWSQEAWMAWKEQQGCV